MGVGTLIIFIAIILVAAVAASVLISTSGSLQQKALMTGSQTEESVASGLEAVALMATDASNGSHSIENFEFTVRLQSGSQSINLNNTVITMDTQEQAQAFDYNTTISKWLYDDNALAVGTHFYIVQYMKEGPDHEDGYITRGDVVKFRFNADVPVGENKLIRVKIIPRVGSLTQVDVTTPDTMTDKRVHLWPA